MNTDAICCLMSKRNNIPSKQRALVLQGGGALGAYEAGAVQALYKYLPASQNKQVDYSILLLELLVVR